MRSNLRKLKKKEDGETQKKNENETRELRPKKMEEKILD